MAKVSVTKSTGFLKFDELIGNLDRARLIIVGGRTAMGKTTFAISMAKNIAVDQQIPTAFFSLEMTLKLLSLRVVCNICQLDNRKIMNGQLTKKEANLFAFKKRELNELPLYIDDTQGLSISEFNTRVRTLIDRHNVRVVIIDYLQLLNGDKTYENRKQESTNVLKRLRGLADELNITIVVLSQLQRRKVRGWIKPTIYSLRVYVSFDKYADVVA